MTRTRTFVDWVLFLAAILLLAGTRFPNEAAFWTLTIPSLALGSLLVVFYTEKKDAAPWVRTLALVLLLVLFVAPPSPIAWLAGVPGWAIVLVGLLALHRFYTRDRDAATPVSFGADPRWLDHRLLIVLGLTVLVILVPQVLPSLLPNRLSALFAWSSAMAPLLGAALVAAVLVPLLFLNRAFASDPSEPSGTSTATEETP